MMFKVSANRYSLSLFSVALLTSLYSVTAAASASFQARESDKQVLQVTDIMQFHEFEQRVMSADGRWLAYTTSAD